MKNSTTLFLIALFLLLLNIGNCQTLPMHLPYGYSIKSTVARYGKKSIILTSNRSMSDRGNIFPDPVMANALMDRLSHNAHQIIIKGESYRKKMRPAFEKLVKV